MFIDLGRIATGHKTEHTLSGLSEKLSEKVSPGLLLLTKETFVNNCIFTHYTQRRENTQCILYIFIVLTKESVPVKVPAKVDLTVSHSGQIMLRSLSEPNF